MPRHEGQVKAQITKYLAELPEHYRQAARKVANPAANEGGMWGAYLELQQIGLQTDHSIIVHKDRINNTLPVVGKSLNPQDVNNKVIHLLLSGEAIGCGHYSLLIEYPIKSAKFIIKQIAATGDCMFDACIQGIKYLANINRATETDKSTEITANPAIYASTIDEIRELRAKVANGLEDNDIRALFINYIFTENQKNALEARLRIPQSLLSNEARQLRTIYSRAIYGSNLLREVASGNLANFIKFIIDDAKNNHDTARKFIMQRFIAYLSKETSQDNLENFLCLVTDEVALKNNAAAHMFLMDSNLDPTLIKQYLANENAFSFDTADKFICKTINTTTNVIEIEHALTYLLEAEEVDINAQESYHDLEEQNSYATALHCAVNAKNYDAIIVLRHFQANTTLKNKAGLTALDIALQISQSDPAAGNNLLACLGDAKLDEYPSSSAPPIQPARQLLP